MKLYFAYIHNVHWAIPEHIHILQWWHEHNYDVLLQILTHDVGNKQ